MKQVTIMPFVCTVAQQSYTAGILARSRPNVTFRETLHILYARLGAESAESGGKWKQSV